VRLSAGAPSAHTDLVSLKTYSVAVQPPCDIMLRKEKIKTRYRRLSGVAVCSLPHRLCPTSDPCSDV
jgi:hypothetical protein